MRLRTVLAVFVVFGGLLSAAAVGLGVFGGPSLNLTSEWVSDTGRDVSFNHHAAVAGRPQLAGQPQSANQSQSADQSQLANQSEESDGQQPTGMAYAPISGRVDTDQCALYGLHAENGSSAWRYQVPESACTIHSVADPTLADYDDDGTEEVLAATTEKAIVALHPTTGEVEFRHNLSSYGYTRPIVADLVDDEDGAGDEGGEDGARGEDGEDGARGEDGEDGARGEDGEGGDNSSEIIVVDAQGEVSVLHPNGSVAWSKQLGRYTWGQPAVADFDGDGAPELAVGIGGKGTVTLFERDGTVAWNHTEAFDDSITWMTTGQADDDSAVEIIAATSTGTVTALDGQRGETEWHHEFGGFAAVHAFGDGDRDGETEVYAVARDGKVRAIGAATGTIEWTTQLTNADVQMTPPPTLGDVDGDGEPELVAATNDGKVAVVAPDSGEVLARYERDVAIFARPVLADVDDDGTAEIFVTYGDGRVVRLSAE
jgi:outer membrane protein assembly factor BamB